MKKSSFYTALFFSLIIVGIGLYSMAAIDTFEGETITQSAYIEGVNTTDTIEGQIIAAAAGCTAEAGMTCSDSSGIEYSMDGAEVAQKIDCDSGITICRIYAYLRLHTSGTSGSAHLEIWDSHTQSGANQIGGDSDQVTGITNKTCDTIQFDWSANKPNPSSDVGRSLGPDGFPKKLIIVAQMGYVKVSICDCKKRQPGSGRFAKSPTNSSLPQNLTLDPCIL